MSRIFISHSSKDDFEAVAIRDWLSSEGWNEVFLDLDPDDGIHPGERWERALYRHASICEAVLFLVSPNWLKSEWCRAEYELARKLNKSRFVIYIKDVTGIPLPRSLKDTFQSVSLYTGEDHVILRSVRPKTHQEKMVTFSREGLRRLRSGLAKAGLDPRYFPWPPAGEPERSPYRGFEALDAPDAGVFFGRDGPIIEALDALRGLREAAAPRLFAILGASGAGKSSFLRAGLLPRLARDDSHYICLPVVRPDRASISGAHGFINALTAVCKRLNLDTSRVKLRNSISQGAAGLKPVLAALVKRAQDMTGSPSSPALVIAIDQAEEIFSSEGSSEAEVLMTLIRDLTGSDNPAIIVIFTIRSDSYDLLERSKPLQGLSQKTFALLPMPRGALQTVIEGPAKRLNNSGKSFDLDPSLTQLLMEDLDKGSGDSLPLLAFTLEQLFHDYSDGKRMTRADYDQFGGVVGAIEAAMERVFQAADRDERIPKAREARLALLRRGLVPWLAGIDPETRTPRRRVARAAQIPQEATPLIDLLVEQRLLTKDTDKASGEVTIEPAHEALIRQWGLLHGWLEEDFGLLSTLEGVKRAARDWDANARSLSWISHQGERLSEAEALYKRPDISARFEAVDNNYLSECVRKQRNDTRRSRLLTLSIYSLLGSVIIGLLGWINQEYIKDRVNFLFVMLPYKYKEVANYVLTEEKERELRNGDVFKECANQCPEMIVIPPGEFVMGTAEGQTVTPEEHVGPPREIREHPQRLVRISKSFAVSSTPVTFAHWDECALVGGCRPIEAPELPRGDMPVVHVTWLDANQYVTWLSYMTGKEYRLLSESEWEYSARSKTTTNYSWGDNIETNRANCNGCGSKWDQLGSSPVRSFAPNNFGLFDMAGNVFQWTADCFNSDYRGAPVDGSAWLKGKCDRRIVRGGSWTYRPHFLRSANRDWNAVVDRHSGLGFRVARTLETNAR